MKRDTLFIAALFIFLCYSFNVNAQTNKNSKISKPNIVFILADDYGYAEVGCYGSDKYKTPNIDKLAKSGLQFNHCYT